MRPATTNLLRVFADDSRALQRSIPQLLRTVREATVLAHRTPLAARHVPVVAQPRLVRLALGFRVGPATIATRARPRATVVSVRMFRGQEGRQPCYGRRCKV